MHIHLILIKLIMFNILLNGEYMVMAFSITKNAKSTSKLDFVNEAIRFCSGKEKENFCSDQNLKLMFEIEKQRKRELELKRGILGMVKNIIQKMWGYKYKQID